MGKIIYPLKVEEIMCKFYLKYQEEWRKHIDELMYELKEAGFGDYVKENIVSKMENYRTIAIGGNTSHCAHKSIQTYKRLTIKPMEGFDNYFRETYGRESPILDYDTVFNLNDDSIDIYASEDEDTNFATDFLVPGLKVGSQNELQRKLLFINKLNELLEKDGRKGKDLYGEKERILPRNTVYALRNGERMSKENIIRVAIVLRLDYETTVELLGLANLGFNKGSKLDLIIMYALKNGIYDPAEIDDTIVYYGMTKETLFSVWGK